MLVPHTPHKRQVHTTGISSAPKNVESYNNASRDTTTDEAVDLVQTTHQTFNKNITKESVQTVPNSQNKSIDTVDQQNPKRKRENETTVSKSKKNRLSTIDPFVQQLHARWLPQRLKRRQKIAEHYKKEEKRKSKNRKSKKKKRKSMTVGSSYHLFVGSEDGIGNHSFEPSEPVKNKGEKAEIIIKKKMKENPEKIMEGFLKEGDVVTFPAQDMGKAASNEKADCYLNVTQNGQIISYKISIKYMGGSAPSIVNQERRSKLMYWGPEEHVKSQQGLSIGHLDCLFKKLNYQRAIGERNEDISFVDIPWTSGARTEMEDLLIHHTFIGAGCGPFASGKQANSILEVGNVENLTTWKLINCFSTDEKRAYVKGKWDLYIYAIRNKGMLVENSYTTRGQLARIDSKWAIPSYIDRKKQMGSVYRFSKCEVIQKEWFAKPKCTLNIRMKKHKN
jgi:hypothetical protein